MHRIYFTVALEIAILSDRSKEDLVEIISNCMNYLAIYRQSHAIKANVLQVPSETTLKIETYILLQHFHSVIS